MGYTHYYVRPKELDPLAFAAFAHDARLLALAWEGPICGDTAPEGEPDPPIFTPEMVCFNGVGDEGCEGFLIERVFQTDGNAYMKRPDGRWWDCCKTQREPYDALVCAVLIAFKHYFGRRVTVMSDGDWEGMTWNGTYWPEWQDGKRLYERVFPERPCRNVITKQRRSAA